MRVNLRYPAGGFEDVFFLEALLPRAHNYIAYNFLSLNLLHPAAWVT